MCALNLIDPPVGFCPCDFAKFFQAFRLSIEPNGTALKGLLALSRIVMVLVAGVYLGGEQRPIYRAMMSFWTLYKQVYTPVKLPDCLHPVIVAERIRLNWQAHCSYSGAVHLMPFIEMGVSELKA